LSPQACITTSTPEETVALPSIEPTLAAKLLAGVTGSEAPITTIAPATGEVLVSIPQANAADAEQAFKRARSAQAAWATTPIRDRARIVLRAHGLMFKRQDEILDLIQLETGKSRLHAYEEYLDGAGSTLYYARRAPRLLRPHRRGGAFPVFTQARELHHPRGVVTTISPWNYPFALSMDVIPALLAGNAVVHKPDNQTPLSSIWARSLLVECGMPEDVWQVVLGDPAAIGNTLIEQADFVGFTGSTPAGKRIAAVAAQSMTPCSLELGGKNPMLVLADADIKATAETAVRACFANAGQLCVAIERIYVDRSRYDEFVEEFARRVSGLKLGSGLDYTADVGSLTSVAQLQRTSEHLADALARGARVVAGGRARPDLGAYFFEPTVLVDVPAEAPVLRDETFGPLVTVSPFDDEEQAVTVANATPYGLNASVFSRDVRRARKLAARIEAGTVNINEGYASAYASHDAPMGGRKESGLGRRHGSAGLLKYTEPQTIASQHIMGFDPAYGMSPAAHVKFLNATLRTLKTLKVR
jgi:succinate-semialdehyde dehydrogenase/glutarate-semialdehyde dehydrogenase